MVPLKINKLVHQPTSMGCFLEDGVLLLGWGMLAISIISCQIKTTATGLTELL